MVITAPDPATSQVPGVKPSRHISASFLSYDLADVSNLSARIFMASDGAHCIVLWEAVWGNWPSTASQPHSMQMHLSLSLSEQHLRELHSQIGDYLAKLDVTSS